MDKRILLAALVAMASLQAGAQRLTVEKETVDCGSVAYDAPVTAVFELRNKGDKDVNEVETCLNALYGTMMLRLQHKTISPDTEHAIKEISTFLGMLSDYHIKDKTEGLKFDDDEM